MIEFNEEGRLSWDHYFLDMSWKISRRSRDPSTKVGAVIVTQDNQLVSQGYNGFPRGVKNTEERWIKRPEKYDWIVHAERNAILNAAREGRSTKNTKMYCFYKSLPCSQCTLSLIQSGIIELVVGVVPFPGVGNGTHYDTNTTSVKMFEESGIKFRVVEDWLPPEGY